MPVRPIPEGYHTLTPYLIVSGAARALDWYRDALGAVEIFRFPDGEGKIGHAEMKLGDSIFMLADEYPERGIRGPRPPERPPLSLFVYVEDVDARFERAVAAGAIVLQPVQDQFYGDRLGMLADPFGHVWALSTHVEDVPPEELEARAAAAGQGG